MRVWGGNVEYENPMWGFRSVWWIEMGREMGRERGNGSVSLFLSLNSDPAVYVCILTGWVLA